MKKKKFNFKKIIKPPQLEFHHHHQPKKKKKKKSSGKSGFRTGLVLCVGIHHRHISHPTLRLYFNKIAKSSRGKKMRKIDKFFAESSRTFSSLPEAEKKKKKKKKKKMRNQIQRKRIPQKPLSKKKQKKHLTTLITT
jgi:hypothetical protein